MDLFRWLDAKVDYQPITDRCLVLDLDETLVHTTEDDKLIHDLGIFRNPYLLDLRRRTYHFVLEDVIEPRGTGQQTPLWGIMRPHLREFLNWAPTYFRAVVIWSAGQPKYVNRTVDHIFRDLPQPNVVYTFPDCADPHQVIKKPLSKLYADPRLALMGFGPHNTLVIDDRESTFAKTNPKNGILIPPYRPEFTLDGLSRDDMALPELQSWLERPEIIEAPNVETLDKHHIFTGGGCP